ncbi:MAG: cytidylate kinase-like family protein [Bacteroidetes bacterium]|nr:cytidylate kinase-like family protein [Bacteroidota bacterium]
MENLLLKYMGEGLSKELAQAPLAKKPIVTISREYGCPSKLIAQMLTDALNKRAGEHDIKKWKFINKEVLESAAKELQLNPADVKYLLSMGEKGLLEDFLVSFSAGYVSNLKVKHTLIKVVNTIAQAGHVVLIGRGSAAILHGRPGSLHIRLQAPVEWRIKFVCEMRGVGADEARHMIESTDKKRTALYELILGKKLDPYIFDAAFNCASLSKHKIVQGILGMMEAGEML